MSIDKNTVKKIANLAKIELTNHEIEIYSNQLTNIIDFMNNYHKQNLSLLKGFLENEDW